MNTKLTLGMAMAAVLAACASAPKPNAALENAHAAVQAAESDPNVLKYAPLDLDSAKKDLAIADAAAAEHHDDAIAQPAYLATQKARLAQVHAATKADDEHVSQGQVERDRIMLAARSREADNAKQAASNAQLAANSAMQDRDRLQQEVDQLKATQTPRGLVLTLGDVLFDTNKSELNPGAGRKLDQLADFLNQHKDRQVQIDGFTDSTGSDAYNVDLSQRRADAVKQALVMRGIDSSRIGSRGYGKEYPVAGNTESGGRQLNRRVEVVIGQENGGQIAPRSGGG
jgi:outer membrane protein OmpA-like peptidoglycan-associated protein